MLKWYSRTMALRHRSYTNTSTQKNSLAAFDNAGNGFLPSWFQQFDWQMTFAFKTHEEKCFELTYEIPRGTRYNWFSIVKISLNKATPNVYIIPIQNHVIRIKSISTHEYSINFHLYLSQDKVVITYACWNTIWYEKFIQFPILVHCFLRQRRRSLYLLTKKVETKKRSQLVIHQYNVRYHYPEICDKRVSNSAM